jgi:hypothetical protein
MDRVEHHHSGSLLRIQRQISVAKCGHATRRPGESEIFFCGITLANPTTKARSGLP